MEEAGHLVEAKSLGSSVTGVANLKSRLKIGANKKQSTELSTTGALMKGYSLSFAAWCG